MNQPPHPAQTVLSGLLPSDTPTTVRRAAQIRRLRQEEDRLDEIARRCRRRAKIMNLRAGSQTSRHRWLIDRAVRVLLKPLKTTPN